MESVSPKTYRDYASIGKKGEKMLYVRLEKALCGCLRSALLFYRKLRKELETFGFAVNPYDACIVNKWVNGNQMTVVWHVEDIKISHKDPQEVTNMIAYLESIYGEMTVKCGIKHTYLSMDIELSDKGVEKICMSRYNDEAVEKFPEDVSTPVFSPASDHFFKTRKGELLSNEQAILFHFLVAKHLFVRKRACPDIQPTIAFLNTRVREPNKDD